MPPHFPVYRYYRMRVILTKKEMCELFSFIVFKTNRTVADPTPVVQVELHRYHLHHTSRLK